MKLSGWLYVVVGITVAIISAVVYLNIPRDGERNLSMAVFFFVGMIFILIGVAKLFFRRVEIQDDTRLNDEIDRIEPRHRKEAHSNKVEAQMTKAFGQNGMTGHSSTYAQNHPYHNPITDAKQQQPKKVEGHQQTAMHQQQATHHQPISHTLQSTNQPQHPVHHYTIVECPKCHTKNYTHSNFCHICGHRLR